MDLKKAAVALELLHHNQPCTVLRAMAIVWGQASVTRNTLGKKVGGRIKYEHAFKSYLNRLQKAGLLDYSVGENGELSLTVSDSGHRVVKRYGHKTSSST